MGTEGPVPIQASLCGRRVVSPPTPLEHASRNATETSRGPPLTLYGRGSPTWGSESCPQTVPLAVATHLLYCRRAALRCPLRAPKRSVCPPPNLRHRSLIAKSALARPVDADSDLPLREPKDHSGRRLRPGSPRRRHTGAVQRMEAPRVAAPGTDNADAATWRLAEA